MNYVVKDDGNKYYRFSPNSIHWVNKQSEAQKFNTKEEAVSLSQHMNSGLGKTRVVKLKCCDRLPEPKIGTVFVEQSRPNIPCIVTTVTDYSDDRDAEVYSYDHIYAENVHCTLEEYWESVNGGEIKIIWEPKS